MKYFFFSFFFFFILFYFFTQKVQYIFESTELGESESKQLIKKKKEKERTIID